MASIRRGIGRVGRSKSGRSSGGSMRSKPPSSKRLVRTGASSAASMTSTSTSTSTAAGSSSRRLRRAGSSSSRSSRSPTAEPFPSGYSKLAKLGEGAYGIVWSATGSDGVMVAVKQCPKSGLAAKMSLQAMKNEAACAELLWRQRQHKATTDDGAGAAHVAASGGGGAGGQAGAAAAAAVSSATLERGRRHFVRMLKVVDTRSDMWLVFEKGGDTLSKLLFDVKGETFKGERVYSVRRRSLFDLFGSNVQVLKRFLREMIEAVAALSAVGIVHADIKPENVLLTYKSGGTRYRDMKLIDLGSAYMFKDPDTAAPTTPEYLPPEMVTATGTAMSKAATADLIRNHGVVSATDMWSVGAIFLEIMCGFPLWMSYKSRIKGGDGQGGGFLKGLFAASGRSADKIVRQQVSVTKRLATTLDAYPSLKWYYKEPASLDLLQGLLQVDPVKRLLPQEALAHPFLAETKRQAGGAVATATA